VSQGRFADAARRLAGQVALLLGWRPDEFWTATPAELATVFAARDEASGSATGLSRAELDSMISDECRGGGNG
jgi:hypothetical protein